MKTSTLILAILLATLPLNAENKEVSYVLEFTNNKVSYIDVPTLNLQLKPKQKSSFEFIVEYASSLFSSTKEQDIEQKNHMLRLALNYEF